MIQRIQSVYLLFAALLTGALLFLTMAQMASEDTFYQLAWRGVYQLKANHEAILVLPTWALAILTVSPTVISGITLLLYKKRMIQIRLCALNLGLLLGLSGMIYYLATSTAKELNAGEISFSWPLVLPIIAFILTVMAIRAIGKDEMLVRSLDRIR